MLFCSVFRNVVFDRPSYCHPWSSGATPFLSKFLLGVQPVSVGFESVTVTPFVSAVWPSLGGAVPVHSGKGVLALNATFSTTVTSTDAGGVASGAGGAATVTITIDSPVPASVGLPVASAAGCTLSSIEVTGGAHTTATSSHGPAKLEFMFTASLPPGKHTVLGHYTACEHATTAAAAAAAAAAAGGAPPPAAGGGVYPFPTPSYAVRKTPSFGAIS